LCLGWKGGCAAHSTFDQAIVLLKYNNQYCNVAATGSVVCNGVMGQFMFQQQSTKTCVGQVKLVNQPSGEACRYDPLASLPSISCGARQVSGAPSFTATLGSNPLASNRNGSVTFQFASTSAAPLSNFAKQSKNDYDAYFNQDCFNSGKRGAFRGVSSVHSNGPEDRAFEWNCAYPSDGFSGFEDTSWLSWTDWDANWQLECPSNEVITHVEAKHDNGREDRQYHVMCGKAPQGMSLDAKPWGVWTNTWDNPSSVDCTADGVLVGIKTENSNKAEDRIWAYRCATLSIKAPPQLSFQVEYYDPKPQEAGACDSMKKVAGRASSMATQAQVFQAKASVVATLGQWDVCQLADGQINGPGHGGVMGPSMQSGYDCSIECVKS